MTESPLTNYRPPADNNPKGGLFDALAEQKTVIDELFVILDRLNDSLNPILAASTVTSIPTDAAKERDAKAQAEVNHRSLAVQTVMKNTADVRRLIEGVNRLGDRLEL